MQRYVSQRAFCVRVLFFCLSYCVYCALMVNQVSFLLWNIAKWVKFYLQPLSLLVSCCYKFPLSNVGPIVVSSSSLTFVEASGEVSKGNIYHVRKQGQNQSFKPVNVKTRKQEMWLRKSAFEKNSINVRYGFQIFAKGELTNFLFFIFGEDRLVQIEWKRARTFSTVRTVVGTVGGKVPGTYPTDI